MIELKDNQVSKIMKRRTFLADNLEEL